MTTQTTLLFVSPKSCVFNLRCRFHKGDTANEGSDGLFPSSLLKNKTKKNLDAIRKEESSCCPQPQSGLAVIEAWVEEKLQKLTISMWGSGEPGDRQLQQTDKQE